MSDSPVRLVLDDGIAILTLSAPQRRNALSTAMRNELLAHLKSLTENDGVRALVLTGDQGHFCSGGDVSEMAGPGQARDPVLSHRRLEVLHDCVRLLVGGAKPVVAAVEGVAFGAGLSFAIACDWVIAAEGARFGAAFGKVGLMGDCGLLWTLPRRVGETQARDLLLTARVFDAHQGKALGVVDEVVAKGQALAAALAKCAQYRAVAPRAAAATKSILARAPASLHELLLMEADLQQGLRQSEDHAEGRRAFAEKRAPVFVGR